MILTTQDLGDGQLVTLWSSFIETQIIYNLTMNRNVLDLVKTVWLKLVFPMLTQLIRANSNWQTAMLREKSDKKVNYANKIAT